MTTELNTAPTWVRFQLTLLFTDLTDSTKLGRMMEPEHYAEILTSIRAIWHAAAAKHHGQIVRSQGDGALISFGFPTSTEEDGRRAAEVALEIHNEVAQLRHSHLPGAFVPLQMHSGIHAGTVLLSQGDVERGRFDLTGDIPNTTAHLAAMAVPGQILANLAVLGPHANLFELGGDPRAPAARASPPDVCAVLQRNQALTRFEATALRGLTPLIGRSSVVEKVSLFLSEPQHEAQARNRCLVLVGSAGLGKTRLLEEVLKRQTDSALTVLRGGCDSYLGAEVLQAFVQMLRGFFKLADTLPTTALQTWRDALGESFEALVHLLAVDKEAPKKRNTTSGIVGDLVVFFAALCAKQRVAVVIDDWQWADDASRQLLGALLELPIGPQIILASRPQESGADWILGAHHLPLQPFNEDETALAVRRWIRHADPFLCAQIHNYAGGTPLFVEELCHSASVDSLWKTVGGGGISQTWLATLVASRLGRLRPELIDLVRACAVIGNVVPLWLLETACGYLPDKVTLHALTDADFLYPDTTVGQINALRFKHGITRDAVYKAIGLHERTTLHERILTALLSRKEALAGDSYVELLSHHSQGAGRWVEAAGFAERAGDKATAAYALDIARTQYQAAMTTLDRIPGRTREQTLHWLLLTNKLGMTCIFDPLALGDDWSVFERAVAVAQGLEDINAQARAKYWLGYMCYGFGRFKEALGHAREALVLAKHAGDARLAAQIEATLGQILAATCDYDEAIALIDIAVDAKRQGSRPRGGMAIGSAYALACKGGVLADRGDFAAAHLCFSDAMELLDGSTHPVGNSVRNWIAIAYIWQSKWQDAERVATESIRIAENTRALLLLAISRGTAGYAAWAGRGSQEGLALLKESMQWMEERECGFYTSLHYSWLVEAYTASGQFTEARQYAVRVFQRTRQGERLGEIATMRAMATAAAKAEKTGLAQRWLNRARLSAGIRKSSREEGLNTSLVELLPLPN